jgi:C4-dicarboxylate-specific signal transduction histidine kinase
LLILEGVTDFKLAYSGEEALKIATDYAPDLILLDIMMPGIDGYEVCRQIRADPNLKFTKIILVSGKAMIDERLKGYEVGADDYMTKPFSTEELLAKAKVFLHLTDVEKQLTELNRALDQKAENLEELVKERTRELDVERAKSVHGAKLMALGEMAGGIAHEINNPLAIIQTNASFLKGLLDGNIDKAMGLRITDKIISTTERIAKIIKGLRSISRTGDNDPFNFVAVGQIIEETLGICREKFKIHDIKIEVENSNPLFQVECREVQLVQVLLNLLNNAYDAIEKLPEKWVKIEVKENPESVDISLTDSGGGLSQSIKDRIYEPFFTTKEVGKGTGLGLSISKGIVELHKGKLWLDDKCKNTRFVISLPKYLIVEKTA